MKEHTIFNKYTYSNIFKLIFFLAFIDFLLFTLHRLSIDFEITDIIFNDINLSDFTIINYSILFLCCLVIFFLTLIITTVVPKNIFQIKISKNTFYLLLIIFSINCIYVYFIQNDYSIRNTSGTIATLPGLSRELVKALTLVIFVIYQLNRKEFNFIFFVIFIFGLIIKIDGYGDLMILISIILFEFFRLNFKQKIYLSIFFIIIINYALELALIKKYGNISTSNYYFYFASTTEYFFNWILPRISNHSEQLYAYISQDLDISNYQFLSKVIIESFFNRLKLIFVDNPEFFYPKTVGQSIVYSMQYFGASGGSSPGYVLSAISFLPFNLPLIILLAFIFKQFSFRFDKKINIIQVACLCFIFKGISANLLDMLAIISPMLVNLFLVFFSTNIYLESKSKIK